ncbi:MAG: hypothetical protein ACRDIB_13235, partial [Ardenticatenaceae bacterium]
VIDGLVQFALEHEGQPVSRAEALAMHLGALNPITDLLTERRRLIIGGYDETIVLVDVLIEFDGQWVRCSVNNKQAGYCRSPVTSDQ